MKIILLEDVHGIGDAGAIETVADGYARNYLFPRKLALPATEGNLKHLDHHRAGIRRRQANEASNARAVAERVSGITLTVTAKAGEAGKLYGSITHSEVAELLAERHQVTVDRRAITFPHPIKTLGEHEAHIRLHKDVDATLKIAVEAEGSSES